MTNPLRFPTLAAVLLIMSIAAGISAQSIVGKGKTGPVPNPVALDTTGMFQAKFVSVGDDMFIAGQPTEKALRDLRAKGVTTVVNLRMPQEMSQVGFDEAALANYRTLAPDKGETVILLTDTDFVYGDAPFYLRRGTVFPWRD